MINVFTINKYLVANGQPPDKGYLLKDAGAGNFIASWSAAVPQPTAEQLDNYTKEVFTDEMVGMLKAYRDLIAQGSITYNAVPAKNDATTRTALGTIKDYLLAGGDGGIMIDWKAPDGTFYSVGISTIEGLIKQSGLLTQKAFSAEKTVLAAHAATPYTTWAAAKAAFDTAMG